MDSPKSLNPSEGHILAGVKIDEHRFLARVHGPQLFQITSDPRDSEDKRKLVASIEAQDLRALREQVQRSFEGAKAKNVRFYADYPINLHAGAPGSTPAIILDFKAPLDSAVDGSTSVGQGRLFTTSTCWRSGRMPLSASVWTAEIR
mgnify:CR=1 FL=1